MPNYTNIHNLPEPLVRAVVHETYVKAGHISVTGLNQPPQKAYLEQLHDAEISEDVSEGIYRLLGSSVHSILERAACDNALQEERLTIEVDGWTVSGKPDLLDADGTLTDFKVTSVYSFLLGDKPEWEAQLNMYAVIYKAAAGFDVHRLQIVAILRDWKKSRSQDENYPSAPALCVDVPLWPYEQAYRYLQARILLHKRARELSQYPECSADERWARPDTWAVKKVGNKQAMRVFTREEEAELWAYDEEKNSPSTYKLCKPGTERAVPGGVHDNFERADEFKRAYQKTKGITLEMKEVPGLKTEIEFRPGQSVRCADGYCKAAPWCQQWARIKAEQEELQAKKEDEGGKGPDLYEVSKRLFGFK